MNTVHYFAVYFATIYDNHKDVAVEKNNFDYIRNYYNSILSLSGNVSCYILHDHLSDDFINKYTRKRIKFVHIDIKPDNNLQPHDLRFYEVYKIIEKEPQIKNIFITDISDCIVIKNGIALLNGENYLYICREGETFDENEWTKDYLKYIYLEYSVDFRGYRHFEGKKLLNSGIVGGRRKLMLDFLSKCVTFMDSLNIKQPGKPVDMITINFVAYTYFYSSLYTGEYLHTRFGFREYSKSRYFKHK